MDKATIAKLEELKETLAKAANLWKAEYRLEVITELHLSEVDTSSDAELQYRPGTISQVITPVLRIEYNIYQPDELDTTYMLEMPPFKFRSDLSLSNCAQWTKLHAGPDVWKGWPGSGNYAASFVELSF